MDIAEIMFLVALVILSLSVVFDNNNNRPRHP